MAETSLRRPAGSPAGRVALGYAESIFASGSELLARNDGTGDHPSRVMTMCTSPSARSAKPASQ